VPIRAENDCQHPSGVTRQSELSPQQRCNPVEGIFCVRSPGPINRVGGIHRLQGQQRGAFGVNAQIADCRGRQLTCHGRSRLLACSVPEEQRRASHHHRHAECHPEQHRPEAELAGGSALLISSPLLGVG